MSQLEMLNELAKVMLPADILEYFDVVHVTPGEDFIIIHLDEQNIIQHPDPSHIYESNGFYEASSIQDFPIRNKKVHLSVRRRRWIDKTTGSSVSNTYELTANGTRYSKEFADFLKGIFG